MKRHTDWPMRLADFVAARRPLRFAWGSNDCALFVADAIVALTGTDFAAGFRGQYDDLPGAFRALRGIGHRSVHDLAASVAHAHGLAVVRPIAAGRGDVGLLEGAGLAGGLALRVGIGWASVVEGRGYAVFPTASIREAWKI